MSWAEVTKINSNLKNPLNEGVIRDVTGNDYRPVLEYAEPKEYTMDGGLVGSEGDIVYALGSNSYIRSYDSNFIQVNLSSSTGSFILMTKDSMYMKSTTTLYRHGLDTKLIVSKAPANTKQLYYPTYLGDYTYWTDNANPPTLYQLNKDLGVVKTKSFSKAMRPLVPMGGSMYWVETATVPTVRTLQKMDVDMNILKTMVIQGSVTSSVAFNEFLYVFFADGTALKLDADLNILLTAQLTGNYQNTVVFNNLIYALESPNRRLVQLDGDLNLVSSKYVGLTGVLIATSKGIYYQLVSNTVLMDRGETYSINGYQKISD